MTNARENAKWAASIFAVLSMMVAAPVCSYAQIFTTLHAFDRSDGEQPEAPLVQGTDGNLYGTTQYGGLGSSSLGGGTVFRISPDGTQTKLYSFCTQGLCTDGWLPWGLVLGSDGNFYGVTEFGGLGGVGGACYPFGCGTVFEITPSGALTTLYRFDSVNGAYPKGGLVQGADRSFYGTTSSGGASAACIGGCGTVFKITPSRVLSTLHSFEFVDGANPAAGLIAATDGNLYGTASTGADTSCFFLENGCGTIFKITPTGTFTVLAQFSATTGFFPNAALLQAADGNFYGTTVFGGSSHYCSGDGCGTLFEMEPSGQLTMLHRFEETDGGFSYATLIQATDGNLYGTTSFYGPNGEGVVFQVKPDGSLTTLYAFCSGACTDGAQPFSGLTQDTDGSLYGTTAIGGMNQYGVIFKLSVGLGPFVEPQPTSGKVGSTVKIMGTSLLFATGVSFNGTTASFKVASSSLITAIVPAEATTGPVQVTLPTGTLTSNVNFQVLP
jgi:uncharacterized repeat protein (TIGR03803 family)